LQWSIIFAQQVRDVGDVASFGHGYSSLSLFFGLIAIIFIIVYSKLITLFGIFLILIFFYFLSFSCSLSLFL